MIQGPIDMEVDDVSAVEEFCSETCLSWCNSHQLFLASSAA